jgi:hypothetical protein
MVTWTGNGNDLRSPVVEFLRLELRMKPRFQRALVVVFIFVPFVIGAQEGNFESP